MKRLVLTATVLLGIVVAANAQPRAIGARLGYATEFSYQHTVGGANFIEANLGTFGYTNLQVSASYNFMIAQPNWTSRGEWGFYAGPGVALGTGFRKGYACNFNILGQIGLEYTFWFPLQLSVDLRPEIGILAGNDRVYFHDWGLYYGFAPQISVRYRF